MQAGRIAARLEEFRGRGAGTDAERRAAAWLAGELTHSGRQVSIETFWCRPNWALAHAWHAALALAGSLVSVSSPRVGGGLILAALVFVLADAVTGQSAGRWLTRQHASQNVVALPQSRADTNHRQLRLILTANYDAGRAGLAYHDWLRRRFGRARQLSGGLFPGWLGWFMIAMAWLEAIAIVRAGGHTGKVISTIQLPPTIGVVLGLALLLEQATSGWSPAAGDNGSGVGVTVALARALGTSAYRHLDVEVVLTGAGDGSGVGLRKYLASHRRERTRANTVVLGVAPCAGGTTKWWRSDGQLVPLRYGKRLRQLAAGVAAGNPYLSATPYDGRGSAPAFPARLARIPALAIGCLDRDGLAPRSHQRGDTATALDDSAADAAVQFGLVLIDAIDAQLGEAATPLATPA
jgi:Peptidase family M28